MKRIVFFICAIFIGAAYAETFTMTWLNEDITTTYDTTTCTAGNDIILPTAPTKRGYTFMGWSMLKLIEYLESTGTQYIDTGFKPSDLTSIKTKIQLINTNNQPWFGGATQWGDSSFEAFYWQNKMHFRRGKNGTTVDLEQLNVNDIVEIDWDKNIVNYSINNVDKPQVTFTQQTFNAQGSMYLYNTHRVSGSTDNPGRVRFYYFQLYDNGTLIRDMIPVLDYNDVPCMYDKVSDQFFYNAGTGNFIAGPAIQE